MSRIAEFLNSVIVPKSLRGVIRNYYTAKRSGYQAIGTEPDASWWIKLVIYLGSFICLILSIVSFCHGYVILPAIVTLGAVFCPTLFWFRNSISCVTIIERVGSVFCIPCNYFKRPASPDSVVKYDRRLRKWIFGRSTEPQTDETETQAASSSLSSEASSENQDTIIIDRKPVKAQKVKEKL